MRLVTRFELVRKREDELYGILSELFNNLSAASNHHETMIATASIENVKREITLLTYIS